VAVEELGGSTVASVRTIAFPRAPERSKEFRELAVSSRPDLNLDTVESRRTRGLPEKPDTQSAVTSEEVADFRRSRCLAKRRWFPKKPVSPVRLVSGGPLVAHKEPGGSRRAVAEELVPKNLVPKNHDSTEVRPANAEAFKATRYRTLPFSLGNERGSCDTSKGVRESSRSREIETKLGFAESGASPRFDDFRRSLTRPDERVATTSE
jgi:hypothetical protein